MDLRGERLEATVTVVDEVVQVAIEDRRPGSFKLFSDFSGDEHGPVAAEAWRIGLMALRNAHLQAEESRLKDVGKTFVTDLDQQLKVYLEAQEKSVQTVLRSYFSPEDGQFSQRLRSFISEDGELVRVLRSHLAEDDSVLAKTLARTIGERSLLFRRLDPEDSDGLVQQLEKKVMETLKAGKDGFSEALDPLRPDSPVARFLSQLNKDLGAADENREKQLKTLTRALDETNDDSLLSRLKKDVERTNRDLLKAMNPADPQSPLGSIMKTIEVLVQKHMEENKKMLLDSETRQKKFESEVTQALTRLETQKQEKARSTHGGFEFEESVQRFIDAAFAGGPYITQLTHGTNGILARKVGDHVIRFTGEHAFAGGGVVVEAKREHHYSVVDALQEIALARQNRECEAGVFVLAASRAAVGFPRFSRFGQDILVTWDPEDATTDPYLHAALVSAIALVARKRSSHSQGDIAALNDIEVRVRREMERLGEMERWTQNIKRDADKIEIAIGKARGKLDVLVRKAAETLKALNVDLIDEDEERKHPVTVDGDSLSRAQDAIRGIVVDEGPATPWASPTRAVVDAPSLAAFRARPPGEDDDEDEDGSDT